MLHSHPCSREQGARSDMEGTTGKEESECNVELYNEMTISVDCPSFVSGFLFMAVAKYGFMCGFERRRVGQMEFVEFKRAFF